MVSVQMCKQLHKIIYMHCILATGEVCKYLSSCPFDKYMIVVLHPDGNE